MPQSPGGETGRALRHNLFAEKVVYKYIDCCVISVYNIKAGEKY